MTMLKLAALDADDLTVISACMQDSVLKTGEIAFAPAEQRLVLPVNRFAWEKSGDRLSISTAAVRIRFFPYWPFALNPPKRPPAQLKSHSRVVAH